MSSIGFPIRIPHLDFIVLAQLHSEHGLVQFAQRFIAQSHTPIIGGLALPVAKLAVEGERLPIILNRAAWVVGVKISTAQITQVGAFRSLVTEFLVNGQSLLKVFNGAKWFANSGMDVA